MFDEVAHRYLRVPYILNGQDLRTAKKPKATIVLLHGINSSMLMWRPLIDKLPKDTRVIGVDLLGYGSSPHTSWPAYQVRIQARSVAATLFLMKIRGPVIVVGHSLGALVAIDFARRYPLMTRKLILVSPPLYDIDKKPAAGIVYEPRKFLRDIHAAMSSHPDTVTKLLGLASQYKLVNSGFDITKVSLPTFLGTLEAAIINQTSMHDLTRLRQDTTIITGKLDPFVNEPTIKRLTKQYPHIHHKSVLAGHEIIGLMELSVTKAITSALTKNVTSLKNER
ncbi:MAG: alpha/beta hydrolase [Candidatus Saccharimonas sp.]